MHRCVNLVDIVKSFPMNIYLQNLAAIQPRTSPVKFARSPCTDPPVPEFLGTLRAVLGLPGRGPALQEGKLCRVSAVSQPNFASKYSLENS